MTQPSPDGAPPPEGAATETGTSAREPGSVAAGDVAARCRPRCRGEWAEPLAAARTVGVGSRLGDTTLCTLVKRPRWERTVRDLLDSHNVRGSLR